MKKTLNILQNTVFESSPYATQEFKDFVEILRHELYGELQRQGCQIINSKRGHFDVSGYFAKDGVMYYFSLPDVRACNLRTEHRIMYRTVSNSGDTTGGPNRWATITETGINFVF